MGNGHRCRDAGARRRWSYSLRHRPAEPPPSPQGAPHARFLIEREITNAKDLTQEQLSDIARTSNDAVDSLGVPYTWVTSYVAGDKIYCLHETDDAETVLEHARRGGFPADTVSVVANEFGPHSADTMPAA